MVAVQRIDSYAKDAIDILLLRFPCKHPSLQGLFTYSRITFLKMSALHEIVAAKLMSGEIDVSDIQL